MNPEKILLIANGFNEDLLKDSRFLKKFFKK